MDHISFLAQEFWESAEVSLRSFSGYTSHRISDFKGGAKSAFANIMENLKNRNVGRKLQGWMEGVKEAWITFKIVDLYDKCVYFIVTEVTRTHIYFGGMCFIFGTLVGIGMGIRIRDSVVAPQKMRAVVANSYRGLEAINIVEDVIAPKIVSPDQVLVQVKAAGIDYLDIKISEGYGRVLRHHLNKYNPNDWGEFPVVLGRDCSGIVVAVGKNVTKVEQGDEVWLAVPVHHQGTLSEYIVVSEDFIAPKPSQLSHECAAALPYNIMKAWDALVHQAGLGEMSTAGKRVLVHAGTSGVGVVAVQLVRAWGGYVTTTVNSQMRPLAHMLGAHDVITYDTSNFEKELLVREKYDVIFNPLGPILPEDHLLEFCNPGGSVVTTTHPNLASDSFGVFMGLVYTVFMRIRYYFSKAPWVTGGRLGTLEISGKVLERVTPLIATGQLQAIVDKTYSAQDAEVAFHHITKGEPIGKTVIRFSIISSYRNLGMAFWQDL